MLESLIENFDSFMEDQEVSRMVAQTIGALARQYQGKEPEFVGEVGEHMRKLVAYLRSVDSPAVKKLPLMARTSVTSFAGAIHKTLGGN